VDRKTTEKKEEGWESRGLTQVLLWREKSKRKGKKRLFASTSRKHISKKTRGEGGKGLRREGAKKSEGPKNNVYGSNNRSRTGRRDEEF